MLKEVSATPRPATSIMNRNNRKARVFAAGFLLLFNATGCSGNQSGFIALKCTADDGPVDYTFIVDSIKKQIYIKDNIKNVWDAASPLPAQIEEEFIQPLGQISYGYSFLINRMDGSFRYSAQPIGISDLRPMGICQKTEYLQPPEKNSPARPVQKF